MGSSRASDRDPLADEAFDLTEAWDERERIRARATKRVSNAFALARGEERPAEPIPFERAEGRRLRDLVGTTYASLVLVSPRFVDVLEQQGFTGWTTFPVDFVLDTDSDAAEGYTGLAITGRCGAIDDSLSERVTLPPPVREGKAGPGLKGLYFPRGTWDGSDLFTAEDRASIFVTPPVKEALEAAGITGVEFRRLSEIERPLLDGE